MKMLEEHLPRASDLFGDEEWCFQQDSAPVHKLNETQDWLSEHCPDFITEKNGLFSFFSINASLTSFSKILLGQRNTKRKILHK
jgi:hypothetical protein